MLRSRWGPGAGRKGSQAWCQSALPTRPGWREFSGSVICSLRTCLCFCNFYFLLSKAEGKPGNKVPFRNARLFVLYKTAYEERKHLLWQLLEKEERAEASGGKGGVWEIPSSGEEANRDGEGEKGFFFCTG